MKTDKRLLCLYIINILTKYTDEKHSLTYSEINKKLQIEYGITADVKTIASYIIALQEYGVDIVKKGNNGCAILNRSIDNSELVYIIDAIFSSKSINAKQAKELIEILMSNTSKYERKRFDYIYKAEDINRYNNKEFFYVIDTISRALEENKKISFTYNEILPNRNLKKRFNGKEFIINPYFMINNNGKYYLVCNYDKYDDLSNYKIEYISNIKILNEPIKPISSLNIPKDFNISSYINEHIYMFAGNTLQIVVKVNNPKAINYIVEWYGENVVIKEKNDEIYATLNVNEQAFLYWALQYGQSIEIVKPNETKEKYVSILKGILNKYLQDKEDAYE